MDVDSSPTTPARSETRIEDDRLLRGRGSFVDDLQSAGQAAAFFVRAPHAFADVRAIDSEAARRHPGVLAVLTAADMAAEGVGNMSRPIPVVGRGGAMLKVPYRPALAEGRVLHVGQPVALVVAESLDLAQQAAIRFPALIDPGQVLAPDTVSIVIVSDDESGGAVGRISARRSSRSAFYRVIIWLQEVMRNGSRGPA